MDDKEKKNIMEALKLTRQRMYDDMVSLELIDGSVPVEHWAPEYLWEIAKDHIESLRSTVEQEFGDCGWSADKVKQ